MMPAVSDLRSKLRDDPPAIGLWASIASSLTAEAAALAGPDYVVIDQQHGAVDAATMTAMLQAISGAGVPALVRVARNEPWTIGNVLDLGAAGVIVPMVEDGEQAAGRDGVPAEEAAVGVDGLVARDPDLTAVVRVPVPLLEDDVHDHVR